MVLPDSHGIPRAPRYSGTQKGRHISLTYGAITHYGSPFQGDSTRDILCNFPAARCDDQSTSHNPVSPTHIGFNSRIGLGSCPFAHHYLGNHFYFLFLAVLRCFNSHRYLPYTMYSCMDTPCGVGCPIRKPPDHSVFATPRGLSQLTTSFIGIQCQGIHRALLVA